ncbi:PDR/VanB family oxidoreductase [Diaphorobacter caeni]|uniref:PDR/VanB family oxidoreductase n=1 Tax=Diaphorobacter caeni TaxID=2784387 RepID=UPI00188DCF06|nr:PDR/VanB family oxidoreductase [Diaphorobacter caeni]MBF5007116.1 oxidoreductase [Diaphorobacter caeni]
MSTSSQGAASSSRLKLLIRSITYEATGIRSYELVDPAGEPLPPVEAGSHIDIHVPNGPTRQYSLCNDPSERHRYVIAVLRDEWGRGGSKAIHDQLQVEQIVEVSRPRNNFSLVSGARKHILVAGGIGVTPLKAMAHQLQIDGEDYQLHYCAKTEAHAAFFKELQTELDPARIAFHFDRGNPVDGLDIQALLKVQPEGAHLYFCGPGGFMAACEKASVHWDAGTVHSEHFKAPVPPPASPEALAQAHQGQSGDAEFSVKLASTGAVYGVPADRSIVQVLAEAGVAVETSCEAGLCGACKVGYLEGEVQHNDFILSDDERRTCLTACVSRATSSVLVLDL